MWDFALLWPIIVQTFKNLKLIQDLQKGIITLRLSRYNFQNLKYRNISFGNFSTYYLLVRSTTKKNVQFASEKLELNFLKTPELPEPIFMIL